MAIAPVHRLKKDEIVWLGTHKCKHSHTYLEHYNCYLEENPTRERIGYFDIECSNLNADFGLVLCYCIKDGNSDEIIERRITKKELDTCLDKEVIRQCIQDLLKFDIIVTYYGTGFDIPYIRAKALIHNLDFPLYNTIKHKDVYYIIKSKFKISRRSLENACRNFLGKTDKTHLDPIIWIKALQGCKESLDYIVTHCQYDVLDLEKLYNKVIDFAYPSLKSI